MSQRTFRHSLSYVLISLFFILTPYTWSYLTAYSGFLIRPIDIVALFRIIWGIFSRGAIIPTRSFFVFAMFGVLLLWLGINYITQNDIISIVTFSKISFYLVASTLAARLLAGTNHELPSNIFVFCLVSFMFIAIVTNLEILNAIGNLVVESTRSPRRALYGFWYDIYSLNLFGPEAFLEIEGNSFRNTASLGFLLIAMICYGLLDSENWKSSILIYIFLGLSIISLSRTAMVFSIVFLLMTALTIRNFKSIIILLFAVFAGLYFTFNSFFIEALNERIGSEFLRGKIWALGFEKLQEAPLWGSGSRGRVLTRSGLQSAHNVVLSLGVEQGLPALISGTFILLFNLTASFIFLMAWIRSKVNSVKRKYQIFTIASLIITVRPFLSASSQNFFSLGEWACFTLMLVGFSYHFINPENQHQPYYID